MTNSPPPDPQSSRTPLGFDEFIGIFVALSTIGGILFWSLSHRNEGSQLTGILPPLQSPTAQPVLPQTEPTASPDPESQLLPPVVPTQSPELTPVPSRNPVRQRIPAVIGLPATTLATPSPSPTPAQPINFVDVPTDFWARPFITALAARGIVNGFPGGYFRPNDPVTRAEFAALLQEAFTKGPGQGKAGFKDIPSTFWAVPAIDRATKAGFIAGYPDNSFRPGQEIPKAQVLVALASGSNLASTADPNQVLQVYKDAGQIPNYAREKIAAATTAGIVVNHPDPTVLNPQLNATRAEVAAIIYQTLAQKGQVEPINSEYVVRQSK